MKKVIIIGGGFGGLAAAKGLANSEFDVLLLDKENHHLFQPLLYQVASAALSPGDIATPIRDVLSYAQNIRVLQAFVTDINKQYQYVMTKDNHKYYYDYLIVAIGSQPFYFNRPEWQKIAPGLKTLDDALKMRSNVLSSFEKAEKIESNLEREKYLNFVVIGGGPTGVELAGAFAEIAKKTLINDFKNFNSSDAKIYLVEGSDRVLNTFNKKLSEDAERFLTELGVEVIKSKYVTDIKDGIVMLDDRKIESKNIFWAAGNKAPKLLSLISDHCDKQGRIIVDDFLSVKNHNNIFVIGDSAHKKDSNGEILPGLAPVASQQGKYLAKYLQGKDQRPFEYLNKGTMATIGRNKAIAEFGKIKLSGFLAWFAWSFIHVLFLINFRNKIMVFGQWALSFLFFRKGVRIISNKQDRIKERLCMELD